VLALLIAVVALLALAATATAAPTITSVFFDSLGSPAMNGNSALPFYIDPSGSGFGSQPPPVSNSIPGYTGSDYGNQLYFCDTSRGWCAGENIGGGGDQIGLMVNSWTDTQFEIEAGSYFDDEVFQLQQGDNFALTVEGTTCSGVVSTAAGAVPCGGGPPPPPATAPTVVTGYPTNLQPTSLTMTGAVNPNGSTVTDCHFDLYSHPYEFVLLYTVPCARSVGGGSQTVNVSANVTGLSPGESYAYQLSAVNAGGTGTDTGVGFSTPLLPPTRPVSQQSKSLLDVIGGTVMEAGAVFTCGVALAGEVPTVGLDTVASEVTCAGAVYGGAGLAHVIADPPSPDYQTVFVPKPFPMPRVPARCKGRRLTPARCRTLRSAESRYVRAVAHAASLSEAAGITSDRYGGAIAAGNISDAEMQATAEMRYLPKLMTAMTEAKKAGRQLGRQLARDHLNRTFSAKQVARARKRLMELKGIPHWVIARLKTDGVISSPADLKEIIHKFLVNAPPAKPTKLAAALEAW
jgi:hypothetical protein